MTEAIVQMVQELAGRGAGFMGEAGFNARHVLTLDTLLDGAGRRKADDKI